MNTFDNQARAGARAAAQRLAGVYGPALPADVERALFDQGAGASRDRYTDPVSVAALIVSVASLAWQVYTDLRRKSPNPSPEVVTRTVRVQLQRDTTVDADRLDQIIEITVAETLSGEPSD